MSCPCCWWLYYFLHASHFNPTHVTLMQQVKGWWRVFRMHEFDNIVITFFHHNSISRHMRRQHRCIWWCHCMQYGPVLNTALTHMCQKICLNQKLKNSLFWNLMVFSSVKACFTLLSIPFFKLFCCIEMSCKVCSLHCKCYVLMYHTDTHRMGPSCNDVVFWKQFCKCGKSNGNSPVFS